ncbi:MAG: LysR family transcriptional regulator [Lachnospiraceae bacterium]|nr:LysR family transcriptional regulator [Lachnospiraceae bacterium]
MLNLDELKQFVTFAEMGTLSKTADVLHVSQPTITRTMQSMEEDFGVSLFTRSKNRIEFNDTGRLAVEYSRKIITAADDALKMVRSYDSSLRIFKVKSCAVSPLALIMPKLVTKYPDRPLSSELSPEDLIIDSVRHNICNIGIVTKNISEEDIFCRELATEKLYISLPKGHELIKESTQSLSFEEIDGTDCLIDSERGIWTDLCYEKLPGSVLKFPKKGSDFEKEAKGSPIPFFATDRNTWSDDIFRERITLPVTGEGSAITYYLISREKEYI